MIGSTSFADSLTPQFKRIIVEDRPVGPRINIQIEPKAEVTPPPVEEAINPEPVPEDEQNDPTVEVAVPNTENPEGPAGWFWARHSAALEDATILSLQQALGVETAESLRLTPDLEAIENLTSQFGSSLLRYGAEYGVSPALLVSIMYVESRGNPVAVSPAGAEGVMQLIPATAERFGVKDAKDPSQAIRGAAAYMKFLLEEFGGDAVLALAGYNAGENAVLLHGGVPPYAETRNYVPKVVAAWRIARSLCLGEHEYPTDGCVFIGMG
ncbi:MAG: lytic transglycosylase domain-containing protein [Pseudomonadota bacterium]